MMDRIEINREVYSFELENRHVNKFLIIEEELDGITQLKVLKGWEYTMWSHIGKRGGMCEVEELLIREDNHDISVSIEDYIKIYRNTFKNEILIEKIFENYDIKAVAKRSKIFDEDNEFYIKKYIDGHMDKITERDVLVFYEKKVEKIEELELFPVEINEKGLEFRLEFKKKN